MSTAPTICIVDDEEDIRNLVADILEDEGYHAHCVANSGEFNAFIEDRLPDMIILDIWLENDGQDGLTILKKFKEMHPDIPVVMISGHGTIETAVESIKYGAYDFIEKPFKSDRLLLLVQRALETRKLLQENKSLKQKIHTPVSMIGESGKMAAIKQTIARAAPTNSRVLVTGEAGTGKDVAARLLHQMSKRADRSFRVLNCAVLRPDKLEIELFGQEKASGSGEVIEGVLEKADGGTLFLDEVADMPLETQGKIVRVIQEQSFNRVGGAEQIHVDVRIITSSNRDLEKAIKKGEFREDLFYRLSVVPVELPPLRERQSDIPDLCSYFISQYVEQSGAAPRYLNDAARAALQSYSWPGNVRQLRNAMEWVMIMSGHDNSPEIKPEDLPPEISDIESSVEEKTSYSRDLASMPLKKAREAFEKDYLSMQLARFDGNVSKTASYIGMERSALHRKIKALDLQPESERIPDENAAGRQTA